MPRLTFQRKLFLALALLLVALLLVFVGLSRWGLQRSLGDYVAEIELGRMDWLVQRLEQGYARQNNWDFLQGDPQVHVIEGDRDDLALDVEHRRELFDAALEVAHDVG